MVNKPSGRFLFYSLQMIAQVSEKTVILPKLVKVSGKSSTRVYIQWSFILQVLGAFGVGVFCQYCGWGSFASLCSLFE